MRDQCRSNSAVMTSLKFPTGPFTIQALHDQEIGEFCLVSERRATDFEAPKLRKARYGISGLLLQCQEGKGFFLSLRFQACNHSILSSFYYLKTCV